MPCNPRKEKICKSHVINTKSQRNQVLLKTYFFSKEKLKENKPLGQNIVYPFIIAPDIHICDCFCISLTIKGVR